MQAFSLYSDIVPALIITQSYFHVSIFNTDGIVEHPLIMTTALNDVDVVKDSFDSGCEVYANKPIDIKKLETVMERLNFKRNE